MRVLALTNLYPSPWLPHRATFNRQQFVALATRHAMHIIAPVSWTERLRSRIAPSDGRMQIRDGITIEHPPFLFTPGCFRHRHGKFYERSVRRTFERAVDAFNPDVVLAAWAYPDAWAAAELCRRFGLPLVAKVHGSDVLLPVPDSTRARQTADALLAADAVIAVSQQLASAVCRLGVQRERVHTIYNGVDTSIFSPGTGHMRSRPPCKIKLLFIGNLVQVKGIDILVDACSLLRDRGVNFECDVIGQGPMRRSLLNQIESLALIDRVRLLGPRPLAALAVAYREADVFVLPSRSEGVPNVVLEAIACGTPVVATRVGGIPEVLEATSLAEPNNPTALADALAGMIASPRVSAFRPRRWSESASELAQVLASVIRSPRKAAA